MRLCILLGCATNAAELISSIAESFPLIRVFTPRRKGNNEIVLHDAQRSLLLQVSKETLIRNLEEDNPTVILSLGWPYLLKSDVLGGPWKCYNCHPSVLPRYRGVSVFYHMIVNHETIGGATFHEIDEGMDTGRVLLQETFTIDKFDTWLSLRDKSEECRRSVILTGLGFLRAEGHDVMLMPQDHAQATVFPRPRSPSDSEFDPTRSVLDLFDHIRGCDEHRFPAYFFTADGTKVCIKMWRAERPSDAPRNSL
tara:strand:- start:422 stop:1180 length:759 start_codon:yes stop_codon:yes gene_type:complete